MAYSSLAPDRLADAPTGSSPTRLALLADKVIPPSAKALLCALLHLKGGALRMRLPDGRVFVFGDGDGPTAEISVRHYRFAQRVVFNGDTGFGESWMDGDWDSPDLFTLLTFLCGNGERLSRYIRGGGAAAIISRLAHLSRANTRAGARRNILQHYDLGNEFYAAWLDPSMTYSSAIFRGGETDLEAGQRAKYLAMAKLIDLKPGDRVLEIGCGWGGFAEIAAKEFGARVTGVTISDAQLEYARARMQNAGLQDRVDIRRQDYRDIEGQFDKIVSIEMLEAVGERYWPAYFAKIGETLKPGGIAALQVITIRDDLFEAYRARADFIQQYVFPGGMLPTIARLGAEARAANLAWGGVDYFAADYAATLEAWADRFQRRWPNIRAMGFDEEFRRRWLYYLAYCAAGFRAGTINLAQISLRR